MTSNDAVQLASAIERVAEGHQLLFEQPSYVAGSRCEELVCGLRRQILPSQYRHAPVGQWGEALVDARRGGAGGLQEYARLAPIWRRTLREAGGGCLPCDHLHLDLDASWEAGATLGRLSLTGHPSVFAGIFRLIEPGAELHPHQDDVPTELALREPAIVLTAVIYLATSPSGGGELDLFGLRLEESVYQQKRGQQNYGVERRQLAAPLRTITPTVGTLLIWRADQLHGVRPVLRGTRITQSIFILYRGRDLPLVLYS